MGNKAVLEPTKSATYNAKAENTIYLTVYKGEKELKISHTFSPLSDAKYFEFCLLEEQIAHKLDKGLSIANLKAPKETLWNELCVSRQGYTEKPDWKEKTPQFHKFQGLIGFFEVEVESIFSDSDLFDDDESLIFELTARQNNELIKTKHILVGQTPQKIMARLDALYHNLADPQTLASAKKQSRNEKLCEIYDQLVETTEGYENDFVPAWHKHEIVFQYFIRRIAEVGKL